MFTVTLIPRVGQRFLARTEILALVGLAACVFFASWTDAFRFGRWLTPSSLTVLLAIVTSAAYASVRQVTVRWHHFFLAIFVVFSTIAALISPNQKTVSYLLAYVFSFVGLGIVIPLALEALGRRHLNVILNVNALTVLTVAVFGLVEFTLRYYFDWNIQDLIPRMTKANAFIGLFPRIYIFSEEPTYVSWYLNTLGILGIYRIWHWNASMVVRSLCSALVLLAAVLTFSVAGILGLLVAILATIMIVFIRRRSLLYHWRRAIVPAMSTLVGAALLGFVIIAPPQMEFSIPQPSSSVESVSAPSSSQPQIATESASQAVTDRMVEKLTGETEDARQQRWTRDIQRLVERPVFGWGPGYISSLGEESSNNLPIFLAAENGIFALLAILAAGLAVLVAVVRSNTPESYVWLMAMIAGAVHLMSLSQFYHPSFWLVIATFFMLPFNEDRPSII